MNMTAAKIAANLDPPLVDFALRRKVGEEVVRRGLGTVDGYPLCRYVDGGRAGRAADWEDIMEFVYGDMTGKPRTLAFGASRLERF